MNRIFKTISVIILIALITVLFGTHMVRSLRNWAAPPPLPYGLTMQDGMGSVEQGFGQLGVGYKLQVGWEFGLPNEGGTPDHIYCWASFCPF